MANTTKFVQLNGTPEIMLNPTILDIVGALDQEYEVVYIFQRPNGKIVINELDTLSIKNIKGILETMTKEAGFFVKFDTILHSATPEEPPVEENV